MTNLQAALGIAQLEKLEEFINKKKLMGHKYTVLLNDIDDLYLPIAKTGYAENVYWVYGIVLNEKIYPDADKLMDILKKNGIGTRPFFWPMHKQPIFKKMGLFLKDSYPVAENIGLRGFYIPSGLAITDQQIEQVAETIIKALK
jgi:perosamine synthetase